MPTVEIEAATSTMEISTKLRFAEDNRGGVTQLSHIDGDMKVGGGIRI